MQRCTANSCTAQGTGERTRVCTSHFTVFTTQGSSFTPTRFLRHRVQVRILFWGLCLWIPDPAFKLDTKFKYVYVGESSCSWLLSSGGVLCSHLYRDCTVGKTFIQHCVSDAGCLIISWFWFADWNSPATPHLKIHLFFFLPPWLVLGCYLRTASSLYQRRAWCESPAHYDLCAYYLDMLKAQRRTTAGGAYSSSDNWCLPELRRWWKQRWMSARLTRTSLSNKTWRTSLSVSSLLGDNAT